MARRFGCEYLEHWFSSSGAGRDWGGIGPRARATNGSARKRDIDRETANGRSAANPPASVPGIPREKSRRTVRIPTAKSGPANSHTDPAATENRRAIAFVDHNAVER